MKANVMVDTNGLYVICPKCGSSIDFDHADGGFWCIYCKEPITGIEEK